MERHAVQHLRCASETIILGILGILGIFFYLGNLGILGTLGIFRFIQAR
jgi:hypothetical protein